MGAGFAIISASQSLPVVIAGILATGSGLGLIIPNQNVWLMAHVPDAARGRASGAMTTLLFAGQFVSPVVSGALLGITDLRGVFLIFALTVLLAGTALAVGRIATADQAREDR